MSSDTYCVANTVEYVEKELKELERIKERHMKALSEEYDMLCEKYCVARFKLSDHAIGIYMCNERIKAIEASLPSKGPDFLKLLTEFANQKLKMARHIAGREQMWVEVDALRDRMKVLEQMLREE